MKADIKRYHDWVREQPCGLCGKVGASEVSHYQGMSGWTLGKGVSAKANHLACAPHCRGCHLKVEARETWRIEDKSPFINKLSHSEGMAIQCLKTLIEAHNQGILKI